MKITQLFSKTALLGFLFLTHLIYAQEKDISGTVIDEGGVPLPGVNITNLSTEDGSSADFDGNYTIEASAGDQIEFSYVGYENQLITINEDEDEYNISMDIAENVMDEVVVVGYGSVRKGNVSSAISSISDDELQTSVAKDVSSALQGRVAGVDVSSAGGQPGSGMNINIRGISTLGSNSPLYVIDGVYGDIDMVNPSDIESMEILKDASAASIYGSRAANGVVLITTKSGMTNRPTTIDVNAYSGIQTINKKLDVLDAQQWKSLLDANDFLPSEAADYQGKGTNWQDEVYRTAPVNKVHLNFSGGGENSTYNVSGGYLNQQGIIRESGYEEITFRTKNTFSFLNKHLRLGNTVMINSSRKKKNDLVITDALRQNPLLEVYDEDRLGGYAGRESWMKNMDNPVGASDLFDNTAKGTEILANAFAEVDLGIEGLKYKLNVGFNKNNFHNRNFEAAHNFGSGDLQSSLAESASFSNQWLLENTLNYDQTFGKHDISALAGYSAQKNTNRGFSASRKDLPEGTDAIDAGSESEQQTGGSLNKNSLTSIFGRLVYTFDQRYTVTASIRRDGSSRFSEGYRFGNFPSVSAGWNIRNEQFFEGAQDIFDELKLRASYGVLGNQEIGNYVTQSTTSSDLNYVQGSDYWQGRITGATWNSPKNLTWEETKTRNIGLDISILDNKLSFTTDYFIKRTNGVLLDISMPPSNGLGGSPTVNAGVVENKGFEFMLTYSDQTGDFKYDFSLNGSAIQNELKEVTVGNTQKFGGFNPHGEGTITWARVGDPIGSFYLVKSDGLFQSQEEIDNHTTDGEVIQSSAKPGDIRFEDYNEDGQITDDDRQYAGNPFPDFSFGIRGNMTYENFDLGFFFDGMVGNKIYNYTRTRMESMNEITNFGTAALDAWTPDNTETDVPRFSLDDNNNNRRRVSDRWLEDGSFFRERV